MSNKQKTPVSRERIIRLTTLAMLSALAVVIGLFKFPILPAAPYLEYDFADVPILIGTALFGGPAGLAILFVVSLIQAFALGGNGIIGFLMHFIASGTLVMVVHFILRKSKSPARMIAAFVFGTLAMTAVMIPLNYIFTPILFGVDRSFVTSVLVPAIIPFNLIKAGGNSALAFLLFRVLSGILKFDDKTSAE